MKSVITEVSEEKQYTREELEEKLTNKEKAFCESYVVDWNASRAAREAGYSEKTCAVIGFENLRKPYIKQFIEFIKNDIEKLSGISKLKIVNELKDIALSNTKDKRVKIAAAAEINKMMGYNAAEKVDLSSLGKSITGINYVNPDGNNT